MDCFWLRCSFVAFQSEKITPNLVSLGLYFINLIISSTTIVDESVYDQPVTIESIYEQRVTIQSVSQMCNLKSGCCWPCRGGACAAVGDANMVNSCLVGHRYNPSEGDFTNCILIEFRACIARIDFHTSEKPLKIYVVDV